MLMEPLWLPSKGIKKKKYGFRVRVVFKITQKDRKVLDWFADLFQCGRVRSNRTTFDWIIKNQKEIKYLTELLLPYLQVKKQQAIYALEIMEMIILRREDLLKAAELADALSRLNVRSENRRLNHAAMIQENCLP